MALNKVTYIEDETVIHAQNLNDIQDEIIANRADIENGLTLLVKEYEDNKPYMPGELVLRNGKIYKCLTTVYRTETWDESKWTQRTLAAGILSNSEYLELAELMASPYSSSATYFKGQFVIQRDNVWEAKQDISTAESWTESHWNWLGSAS